MREGELKLAGDLISIFLLYIESRPRAWCSHVSASTRGFDDTNGSKHRSRWLLARSTMSTPSNGRGQVESELEWTPLLACVWGEESREVN